MTFENFDIYERKTIKKSMLRPAVNPSKTYLYLHKSITVQQRTFWHSVVVNLLSYYGRFMRNKSCKLSGLEVEVGGGFRSLRGRSRLFSLITPRHADEW